MEVEIRVPEGGESVTEALLAEWFKADGDLVQKDEALFLLETDKITLEVPADADGALKIGVPAGETVTVGQVVGTIDTAATGAAKREEVSQRPIEPKPATATVAEGAAPAERGPLAAVGPGPSEPATEILAPSVRRLVAQEKLDPAAIPGTGPGGRLTKGDVVLFLEQRSRAPDPAPPAPAPAGPVTPAPSRPPQAAPGQAEEGETTTRKPMSPIRRRIAERLLEAKQGTAMLTTFNEVDMGRVQALRAKYKEAFREKHGVSLGIASFFLKALVAALEEFPELNAFIEGDSIVYHNYYHMGVAVGAERGLVVPVIRNAEGLGLAEIERTIAEYVEKIRANRLELSDLEGGTFTITNGGVFGSLLSTPILNPPQSGILGLHKIEQRPVVVDDEIVVRPMMYVALSYDHRIVDGRQAVQFLVRVKEEVEDPERLLVEV